MTVDSPVLVGIIFTKRNLQKESTERNQEEPCNTNSSVDQLMSLFVGGAIR
jgi:hypothetical protein